MATRKTYFTYITLFILAVLVFSPCMTTHAQTTTDIKKPTRERVKDKKENQDKKTTKQEEKQEPAKDTKQDAKAPLKQDAKAPAKVDAKAGANPATDTAAKKAADPPKPKKTPLDPDVVQFDGIDVSKHQGDINWEELKKNSQIKYVYIKATEGSDYIDPRYRQNIKEARRHGFKVGSYHFLSNKSSATSQFINFAKTANRDEQDLIPIIDVETCKLWTSQQLRDSLKVFADLLEDYYGCKPMIYTSEKFFTKHLGRSFADYPLFIAKYNTAQPNIGYKWIMWQFSDCGLFKKAMKGNNGEVDLSRFNKGCSINDIIYRPVKGKPKISVMDAVDKNKEKPSTINLTEQGKTKEAPKPSAKQKEEDQKKAERAKKATEREKRVAEEEAKKKAKEKAEQEKKNKAKTEQENRQKAKEQKAKEEAEAKAKQRKAAEQKAKEEAEAKAKRKAAAQKAKQESSQQKANNKQTKTASLLSTSSSTKLTQSQRNDSIRNAQMKGRKTNKSSADND